MDWFFGFKLHLVVNDCGELLSVRLTPGNTDDRRPVPELVKGLFGKLFADKGYVSQPLFETLFDEQVQLVTKLKARMKNRLTSLFDKLMLRKRAIIESVMDQLKNVSQIEHSRHRSTDVLLSSDNSHNTTVNATPVPTRRVETRQSSDNRHR